MKKSNRNKFSLPAAYTTELSSCGKSVAFIHDSVEVISLADLSLLRKIKEIKNPSSAVFSLDLSRIMIKSTAGSIYSFDVLGKSTGDKICDSKGGEGANILLSPDGAILVDPTWGGDVFLRNHESKEIVEGMSFPNEMIMSVSRSLSGDDWLFFHQPQTLEDENFSPPPYLSLWRWPFRSFDKHIAIFDVINSVVISPDGHRIACSGFDRDLGADFISVLDIRSGEIIRNAYTACAAISWSKCGKFIGVAAEFGGAILSSDDCSELIRYEMRYVSSVKFVEEMRMVLVSTWDGSFFESMDALSM